MMNEYKRFKEQAAEEWESMKYRRMELRGGKQGKKDQFWNLSMIYIYKQKVHFSQCDLYYDLCYEFVLAFLLIVLFKFTYIYIYLSV